MALHATRRLASPAALPRTGTLRGGFPYVRVGNGPRTLVVLPGLGDAMFSGRYPPPAGPAFGAYVSRYLDRYTVYVLSRPRGLGEGATIESLADEHVPVLEDLAADADGLDVIGISMGGMIALDLAARKRGPVDRLVLANSAHRLGDAGREPARRMLEYAHDRDWTAIRSELATAMFSDWRQFTYPPLLQTIGRFLQPRPADPTDVVTSLEAILAFDASNRLDAVATPTLVIGGSEDPYFPPEIMGQTAEGVRDGTLSLIDGGKHAAFHEHKRTFDARTTRFLTAARDGR